MKKYLKENIRNLPFILVAFIMFYSITTLATNYLFNSNEVSYDNTETGLHADEVQGAIDEVFQHATDYSELKTKIGTNTLTTTSQTLIGGINELKTNVTSLNDQIANCITGEYYITGYNSTGSDWETVKQINVPANSMFIGSITSGFYNSSYLGSRIVMDGQVFAESGSDKPASCSFFTGANVQTVKLQTKHSGAGINNTWVSYAYIKL